MPDAADLRHVDPSVLFLTHYLPDDPAANQMMTVGSLILGQNGIWGDLLSISSDGVTRMARLIAAYRQVRDDVTSATALAYPAEW